MDRNAALGIFPRFGLRSEEDCLGNIGPKIRARPTAPDLVPQGGVTCAARMHTTRSTTRTHITTDYARNTERGALNRDSEQP